MPTFLFEQPWIVGTIGSILTVASVFGWLQTGNRWAAYSAIGFALITVLMVLMNLWVVTDREEVTVWLFQIASEVENNETPKVMARISHDATDRVRDAAAKLPRIKFLNARITKIHKVEIQSNRFNAKANVRMNVFVEADIQNYPVKAPRWIGLSLQKIEGKWLLTDFEDREPQHEFMGSDDAWPSQLQN